MTKIKFFQGLLNSLFEKPKINKSLNFLFEKKKALTTLEYVENVASARGEVSALGHAELLITHCEQLNDKELIKFFEQEPIYLKLKGNLNNFKPLESSHIESILTVLEYARSLQ